MSSNNVQVTRVQEVLVLSMFPVAPGFLFLSKTARVVFTKGFDCSVCLN